MTDDTSDRPLIPSERVRGARVFSADGEKIGKIEDIAIDKLSGVVAYAILGRSGHDDDRYRPLRWTDLTYDEAREGYVIPHTQAEINAMASLDGSQLSGWRTVHKAALI
jgi:sporulation protein YlmC with PRC-barrel domain